MRYALFISILFVLGCVATPAQTSEMTYQGNLRDSSIEASGTYQMRFSLYDAASGGTQVGGAIEVASVEVSEGLFSVSLDFGAAAFDGSDRFLQIEVRRNSGEAYVPLTPRQKIDSVPYSIRSLNAQNADTLDGLDSAQFVTASSNDFIRNGTTRQTADLNISGTAKAGVIEADIRFDLSGQRFISTPGSRNLFVGLGSGNTGAIGFDNAFFGVETGLFNTASFNSFFGTLAGAGNSTGSSNSFFGERAGTSNTTGCCNSFFGSKAGNATATGIHNTFVGNSAGVTNTTGSNNTLLGSLTNVGSADLSYATAIGARTTVSTSNTIVLGRSDDNTNISGELNVLAGASAPVDRGDVNFINGGGNFDLYLQGGNGTKGINLGVDSGAPDNAKLFISQFDGTTYLDRVVINHTGAVEIRQLGPGGSTDVCRNSNNELATCSSSLRYKRNIADFSGGLNIVRRLRPITFEWKEGGMEDVGFGAEEVAGIDPLLVTYNERGEVEGVKYDRLGVVLVNAVREQQKEIEEQKSINRALREKLERQQTQIDELRRMMCAALTDAEICREKKQ